VLENLDLYVDGIRGIRFGDDNPNRRIRIDNVVLHGVPGDEPDFGIAGRVQDLTIIDTEVYDIDLDGLFFGDSFGVDIIRCYIHHVNLAYHEDPTNASGDGIQFISSDDILIKETTIDRIGTGKKFNVIFTNTNDNITVDNIVLEDNHFIGPGKYDQGGASIFLGVESVDIRRNKIEGALIGVYTHSPDVRINNNLFVGNQTGVHVASHGADIYNNVFYDHDERAVYSWLKPSVIKNNIIYLTDPSQLALEVSSSEVDHNLQNISSESSNFDAGTIADPQFVDAANENFYIEENSPAIDNAVDVGVAYDYAENPVPCGGTPDVGAYEYQGNCDSGSNNRPVADAGPDQTVDENSRVDLDGSGSSDPDQDALSYDWSTPSDISLSDAGTAQPYFTAPDVDSKTSYLFVLEVSDGNISSSSDSVYITVRDLDKTNHTPVADAGSNQVVEENSWVELDGSNSYDPDQDSLRFIWNSPDNISLSDSTAVSPYFEMPERGFDTICFKLTVTDGELQSDADSVMIIFDSATSDFHSLSGSKTKFVIYPNPARNYLNINAKIAGRLENLQVSIYSINGVRKKTTYINGIVSDQNLKLNINDLSEGVFILDIRSGDKRIYRSKFVVIQ
jgi:hypothetical protein